MSAVEIRNHLRELEAERRLALVAPPAAGPTWIAELDAEITEVRHAYVGAAVTEIATLRAELSGPQVG